MDDAQSPIYDLSTCLQAQAYRSLVAIARFHSWPFDTSRVKTQVVEGLVQRLRAPEHIAAMLAALGNEARAALRTLLRHAGQLAQAEFIYRFGEFRPYRPWREDAPDAPWTQPRSPAEALIYRGMIFPLNLGTSERPVPVLALPLEYHAPLRAALAVEVRRPAAAPSELPVLLQHLFAFLSYLQRAEVSPLHERWLAPRHFRALAPFLGVHAPEAAQARSELQFRYLAFLHYLAERVGWIDRCGGYLRPTARAWDWVNETPQAQYQALWQAWGEESASNNALWQRYRLPLQREDAPPARLAQLAAALARRPPDGLPVPDYLEGLQAAAPRLFRPRTAYQAWADTDAGARRAYRARMRTALGQLLRGPLVWFGVLRLDAERLTLTALGGVLIGRTDGAWPTPQPPMRLAITVETSEAAENPAVQLHVVPREAGDEGVLTPARRLALEQLLPPDPATPHVYTLRATPVQRALQQGRRVDGVLTLLEQAVGPLPPVVVGALYRWAAAVARVRVRRITVLEADDAALLRDLTAERRIRETLLETLSARVVCVDASQLEALLRRLAYRGLYPRLELPDPAPTLETEQSAEERITLGAALTVYATLVDRLSTDLRPPHTLAWAWRRRLTDAERDAVERQVKVLLDALRRATPAPAEDHLPRPTGETLTILERAIAEDASVEIRYYTAGRDHVSERRVDPLRLEWRGEVAYLIAYCHLRQAQRVFRVDRIEALRLTGA